MAWQLSHTDEAIANASANLRTLDRPALETVWAEWCAYHQQRGEEDYQGDDDPDYFDDSAYASGLAFAESLPTDTLADGIERSALDPGTTDNGGHALWICPYGCHTVSFDPPTEG